MAGPVDPRSAQGSLLQQKEKPCGSPLLTRVLYQVLTSHWLGRAGMKFDSLRRRGCG